MPVAMLEGNEGEVAVPKIGRAKRRRDELVNDLGYRMTWEQSRVFAGRTMFLQRARKLLHHSSNSFFSIAYFIE